MTQPTLITLASFNGSDGSDPIGNLTVDAAGNVFGTTYFGGDYGGGTAFELVAGSGQITKLFSFGQTTPAGAYVVGANPESGLIEDGAGNLYGTTPSGGPSASDAVDAIDTFGVGTVFEIPFGTTTAQVIYSPQTTQSFTGYVLDNQGRTPASGLIMDAQGNLFGTTSDGGGTNGSGISTGGGTIFEIAAETHVETTLGVLPDDKDDGPQDARLVEDTAGNLYGTTAGGGANGTGSIFEVVKGSGVVTTLASFDGSADNSTGYNPEAGLVIDAAGNLYGTARQGGSDGAGTVFELAAGSQTIMPIVSFGGSNTNDWGTSPWSDLLMDAAGNLFGTTSDAGSMDDSTVFEVMAGTHALTVLATLPGRTEGVDLTVDASGNLYGAVNDGGSDTNGSIFELTGTGFVVSAPPSVILAITPEADNAQSATLGTATSANTDPLIVALTSDTAFSTGSSVSLTGGTLTYKPGLITTAQAGSDTIGYAVTDTITGAVTTETQTVSLSNGPAPIVTLATPTPVASNAAGSTTLGMAAPGFGSDALTVVLTSDTDFAPGSSNLALSNGSLVYTPGLITAAKVGSDTLNYTVTDNVTGAVTLESQTITLAAGTAPLVTLANAPAATNTTTATLGTVSPANASVANDSFSVALTSDAAFANGSNIVLTNGSLIYTPGLVTAGKAGSDTLHYTVTDTTNGSTTQETQTVTLGNGPAPTVTLATAPTANNSQAATLGSATAGFGSDPLTVTLTSDADFAPGSSNVTLSNGSLVYTPGLITAAGSDALSYTVTDTATGATTTETQTVTLSPTSLKTLANFDGTDGELPFAGLIPDAAGNLYGTTGSGGSANAGTVFELAKGATTITPLASFTEDNGALPFGALISDAAGNLYGTTVISGNAYDGTVFELVKGATTITTLASFTSSNDSAGSVAGLISDTAGNLYGTTEGLDTAGGEGTVFELAKGTSTIITLASIPSNGSEARVSGLIADAAGNLYGTTQVGGSAGAGSVYELAKGSTTISTLASFTTDNGAAPVGALIMDAAGNLYGTTSQGGASGDGTVFELAKGSTTVTTPANFSGDNGEDPLGGLIVDAAGNLYGTASQGGSADDGTVFELAKGTSSITTLATFTGSNGGAYPLYETLMADAAGNLYGTTGRGGSSDDGTVFELTGTGFTPVALPIVTLANAPSADNTHAAVLGTVVAGASGDTLSVALTSDADFATGSSSVKLSNGNLVYTPGLITAAQAGSDVLNYTVTDTVTGATTRETQSVTLRNGPAPVVTLATSTPVASNASGNAMLGKAAPGFGNDAISLVLTSDADFATGSTINLVNGALVYAPGLITTADAGSDVIGYTVTDTVTGAITPETQTVTLVSNTATLTTLASFDGSDGADPFAGVTVDAEGNLFGTTRGGGIYSSLDSYGTIFEIPVGSRAITSLVQFDDTSENGVFPDGRIVLDGADNLYSTTNGGGYFDAGTVFELTNSSHSLNTLVTFNPGIPSNDELMPDNGGLPFGGLTTDAAGNLYGTTQYGGSYGQSTLPGAGTVFEITANTHAFTTLATFDGSDGSDLFDAPTIDSAGNIYGTAELGGGNYDGTVFEIAAGTNTPTVLATFNGTNGANPYASLVIDDAGNLYGTTTVGGSGNDGTVFEIAAATHVLTTLVTFNGSNGANPFGGLTIDAAGNLYGTTNAGGSANDGIVFKIAAGTRVFTTLYTFNGTNGAAPGTTVLTPDAAGNLYGTTEAGGSDNDGTVFELSNTGFVVAAAPIVSLTTNASVENGSTVTLGTVSAANPSVANDSFAVTLTSDADFASGSTLVLRNGSLVYTPGLVTAAQVGSNTLHYTVTDTTNGSTTQEIQTVTLGNGPAPVVTATAAPVATNAGPATLGTVLAGFGNDALAVSLTGDSVFGVAAMGGSHLALSNGALIYTPGLVTSANAGTDAVSYIVTDTVTGASAEQTQSVSLDPGPQLAAGSLLIGHGQAEDVTSLVNGLVTPGLPGDTETIVAATGGATLANARILYTAPSAGGATSFGFTVQDQNQAAAQGTVAVTVDPGPSAGSVQTAVNVGQTVDLTSLITTAALVGEAGDTVTLTGDGTAGTKGSVTLSNGDLTYTANGAALDSVATGSSASDSFTYTLADQLGDTTSGTVTLSITQPVTSVTGPAYGSGTLTQTPGVTSLVASGYSNTINATVGDATINAGSGNATVNGGDNSLTVLFNGYLDKITGGNGNDTVSGTQGLASISLGGGNDGVTLGGYVNSVVAGNGNDTVSGGQGNDTITLGNGQDSVSDSGYSNVVTVGTGNDTIVAGAGFDTVKTGGGTDTITLSGYFNTVTTTGGNNTISGASNTGGNTLTLGNGNDTVTLGGYNNTVTLGNGTSIVDAGAGNATIVAGTGSTNVTLHGYNNSVSLGAGTNTVNDGAGNDVIHLSGGTATLDLGGLGDMVFLGGSSATITDTASYLTLGVSPGGTDVIQDFGAARGNIVDLLGGTGGFSSATAIVQALTSDGHGGTLLTLGTSSSIDFVGLTPQAFTVANFRVG